MVDHKELTEKIKTNKLIAILRGIEPENMEAVGTALLRGGICFAEVTFGHGSVGAEEKTLRSIGILKERFGSGLGVGAGTVLNANEVQKAVLAGAEYIISPNVSEEVIRKTKELGAVSIPGAATPTEIVKAYELGADIVKVFPADFLGPAYIRAVRGPLAHIPLVAVGGIDAGNIPDFLKAGICGFGIGGNLVSQKAVREGRFRDIEKKARELVDVLKACDPEREKDERRDG